MALFSRRRAAADNNDNNDANDGGDGKKKGSKRPASKLFMTAANETRPLTDVSHRHRVQAAAVKGLAAYFDTEDCTPDTLHHWTDLCTHRWTFDLGEQPGKCRS